MFCSFDSFLKVPSSVKPSWIPSGSDVSPTLPGGIPCEWGGLGEDHTEEASEVAVEWDGATSYYNSWPPLHFSKKESALLREKLSPHVPIAPFLPVVRQGQGSFSSSFTKMKEMGGLGLEGQGPGCPPVGLGGQVQHQGESGEAPDVYSRGIHVMLLLSEPLLARE